MELLFLNFKLYFILQFLFLCHQNPEITLTPVIEDVNYPIIFNANDQYYNVITQNNLYVVDKANNSIKYTNNTIEYSPPFLLFMDKNSNYFLFTNNNIYNILLNRENEIVKINSLFPLTNNNTYFGYIMDETSLEASSNDFLINEVILYGKTEFLLYFYYFSENKIFNC